MLVTGGAKGIGRMISEGFVQNGAKVYISSRDASACEQAAKELNALGMPFRSSHLSHFFDRGNLEDRSLTRRYIYRQRLSVRHSRRFLQGGRLQSPRK